MIKVSDFIVKRLIELGITDVFMISGGGAMHLNDSVGKCRDIKYICNHHEQASAIGAEGYARVSGKIGVVIVTSGPGGTNTLTGVIGQWLDSVPVLYISGQVKFETTIASCPDIKLRQLGDQEINIVDIVKSATKFAVMVKDPLDIKKYIDKAIYLATHGRPGPVWLDIPLDVQGAKIEEKLLKEYDNSEDLIKFDKNELNIKVTQVVEQLKKARRPVFIAGNGIRIAGAKDLFLKIAEHLGIPIVSTFNGFDLVRSNHPLFIGRIGSVGDRAGNFTIQNSDLLLSIGSRNSIRQVSYNWRTFARTAKKIIVDIDEAELNKPTIKPDIPIHADAGEFLLKLKEKLKGGNLPKWDGWLIWCKERKSKYPVVLPEYKNIKKFVQPYYFAKILTECLKKDDTIVAGNGTACVVLFQAGVIKGNQRIFWNSGCASMGYDLPAAIGACFGNNKKDVICIAGDGSIQMNIQELQTIIGYNLPVKIFYLNNEGYISIKQTQDTFFEGRKVACDCGSGVSFPDIIKVAKAYGLKTEIIDKHKNIKDKIKRILSCKGPLLCEVKLVCDYKFSPKLSSEKKPNGEIISKPVEDMYPFLGRDEFYKNMILDPKAQQEKKRNIL